MSRSIGKSSQALPTNEDILACFKRRRAVSKDSRRSGMLSVAKQFVSAMLRQSKRAVSRLPFMPDEPIDPLPLSERKRLLSKKLKAKKKGGGK